MAARCNDGTDGIKLVLNYFGLSRSVSTTKLIFKDQKQIANVRYKSTSICKKHIKKFRFLHKGYLDNEKTVSYSSGGY